MATSSSVLSNAAEDLLDRFGHSGHGIAEHFLTLHDEMCVLVRVEKLLGHRQTGSACSECQDLCLGPVGSRQCVEKLGSAVRRLADRE